MSALSGVPAEVSTDILAADIFIDGTLHHKGEPYKDDDGYLVKQTVEAAIKGLAMQYSAMDHAVGIPTDWRKIMILGHGLSVTPQPDDKITIGEQTYTIHTVSSDPAKATWTFGAS